MLDSFNYISKEHEGKGRWYKSILYEA